MLSTPPRLPLFDLSCLVCIQNYPDDAAEISALSGFCACRTEGWRPLVIRGPPWWTPSVPLSPVITPEALFLFWNLEQSDQAISLQQMPQIPRGMFINTARLSLHTYLSNALANGPWLQLIGRPVIFSDLNQMHYMTSQLSYFRLSHLWCDFECVLMIIFLWDNGCCSASGHMASLYCHRWMSFLWLNWDHCPVPHFFKNSLKDDQNCGCNGALTDWCGSNPTLERMWGVSCFISIIVLA